jgi:hypothetical protein
MNESMRALIVDSEFWIWSLSAAAAADKHMFDATQQEEDRLLLHYLYTPTTYNDIINKS